MRITKEFYNAIDNSAGKCVLLVGAGLSAGRVRKNGKGLPDWRTLVSHMIEYLDTNEKVTTDELKDLRNNLSDGDFLEIARVFKRATTGTQFDKFIRDHLDPDDIIRSEIHQDLLSIGFRGIMTTNFDTIFEQQGKHLSPIVYPTGFESWRIRSSFFAKIHGCVALSKNLKDDLILTQEDYSKLLNDERYRVFIKNTLLNHTILTIGYSLQDPDFNSIYEDLKSVFPNGLPTIYSIVIKNHSENKHNHNDKSIWREKGVELLQYDSHDEIKDIIKDLKANLDATNTKTESGFLSPIISICWHKYLIANSKFKKWSSLKKLIFIHTAIILFFALTFNKNIYEAFSYVNLYLNAANDDVSVALDPRIKKQVLNTIDRISKDLLTLEYPKRLTQPKTMNPWTMSQIVTSTNNFSSRTDTNFINGYLHFLYNSSCWDNSFRTGWKEFSLGYVHSVATSWILISLSNIKVQVDSQVISSVIRNQNDDGWWSLLPSKETKDASTVATVFNILALNAYLRQIRPSGSEFTLVQKAILNGVKWLRLSYSNNGNTVYDYPNSQGDRRKGIALTAYVLHAINEVEPNSDFVLEFNQKWVQNLKKNEAKLFLENTTDQFDILSVTQSGHTINTNSGSHDDMHNYDLPWFIIASVDAYKTTKTSEKVEIIKTLDKILKNCNSLYQDAAKQPWLVSEFLVALRIANSEKLF